MLHSKKTSETKKAPLKCDIKVVVIAKRASRKVGVGQDEVETDELDQESEHFSGSDEKDTEDE